ncbi:MAG: hypothetical protein AB8B91_03735 [Rubripirellula sp.]
MKLFAGLALALLLIGTFGFALYSQAFANEEGRPRPNTFTETFDTDSDGEISTAEIKNASKVLQDLDQDQNGKLTHDEIPRPPRPSWHGQRDRQPPPPPREEAKHQEPASDGAVVFHGGHETDARDNGRPVALIAAALGVETEVFRDAFSGVTPSRFGPPSASHARANKKVLMDSLGKHGVSNERLDEVSNYYRYNRGSGEVWNQASAIAEATVKNGKVISVSIIEPGSGYLQPPTVTVVGHPDLKIKATLGFSKNLTSNGRIELLEIVRP